MSCGIQKIEIVPEVGTVVNQDQEFRARVTIKNTNAWELTECKVAVTGSTNCNAFLEGITSFNMNNINAGSTVVVDIPFTANGSSVGNASVTLTFDSILDSTHYYTTCAGCWDMVNPKPLTCSNSKSEKFEIVAE
jgi:hypothetical protein